APAATLLSPGAGAPADTAMPVLMGVTEPNAWVAVVLDGVQAGTPVADSSGSWRFSVVTPLSEGIHTVSLQATDLAGNVGPPSGPQPFLVQLPSSYYQGGCSAA